MSRIIETNITAVTVLSDRAVVTRTGKFEVSSEDQHWSISPLPLTVAPDSIRVKGKGNVPVKFLAIATETIVTIDSIDEKIAPLDQQIQTLQTDLKTVRDRLETLQVQQNFIINLSKQSVVDVAKHLATGKTDLNKTESLLNFVGQQHQVFSEQIQVQHEIIQQLNREIQALEQQKSLLQNPQKKRHYALALTVEVGGTGEFNIEVTYQVSQARWVPRYDLAIATEEKHLTLDYLADVFQSTGEDWHNADLTISTAQVQQGIIPPELWPWYLNVRQYAPTRKIFKAAKAPSSDYYEDLASENRGGHQAALGEDEMEDLFGDEEYSKKGYSEEYSEDSNLIIPDVQRQGSTVTFQVGSGGDIPSDNNPHQVNLFHGEYSIELNHFAIPRLVSFAYLQAKFTNPVDGVTLLAGTANIFRDQTFVGKSELPNISAGQEVTLNLGIDEVLQIERKLCDRQVDKTLISQLRRITYGYEISVKNLGDRPQTLILQEHIPVSRNEKIKVNLQKIDPKIDPTKLGILEWKTILAPNAETLFFYQFTVEHPPTLRIAGLAQD